MIKRIPITEYSSSSVSTKYITLESINNYTDLKISPLRLVIATAKCSFTKTPSWIDGSFEAISTFLRLNRMVADSSGHSFLLKKQYINNLRDFSRTSRLGELAQGINFLLAQEVLKIPTPVDFFGYCKQIHNVEPTGKTPDFIGCTNPSHYILIESKGSLADSKPNIKGRLRDAIKQCDAGEMFLNGIGLPNAERKFGAVAIFGFLDPYKSDNNSSICFCDPSDDNMSKEFEVLPFLTFYYQRLFEGFLVNSEFGSISSNQFFYDLKRVRHKGVSFVIFNSNDENILVEESFLGIGDLPEYIQFGISENILKSIERGDLEGYFSAISDIYESFINSPDPTSENAGEHSEYEVYADGTIFDLIW